MDDWLTISSGELTAKVNPFGAELSSLTDRDGRELMTDADPAFWTGRAPILFPVIGVTNGGVIRLDGAEYAMPKHGFARHSRFTVARAEPASLELELTDSPGTREAWPFAFRLAITFRVEGATLHVEAGIENRDDRPLPAQFGFHPAFAWPLPFGQDRAAHRVVFTADEPDGLLRILPDGLIAPDRRPSPLDGRVLALRDALFVDDALVWDPIRSQAVTYGAEQGPSLHVAFPDTPRLGIWTKPGARYVCIEPWHGLADPEGFAGEFRDKPGVFEVPVGAAKRIGMSIMLAVEGGGGRA